MTLLPEYQLSIDDFEIVGQAEEKWYSRYVVLKHKKTGRKCMGRYILDSCTNPEARLLRLVNLGARLRHPCLQLFRGYVPDQRMTIGDAGENGSLATLMELEIKGQAPPEWDPTKKTIIFWGVAACLKYLHAKNIVSRNVKPSKILLDKNYEPHLSDMSICQIVSDADERVPQEGRPNRDWASPEQQDDNTVGLADDVYSLGLVLRYMVQGDLPKEGEFAPPLARDAPETLAACYAAMTQGSASERAPIDRLLDGMKDMNFVLPGTDTAEFQRWKDKMEPFL